MYLSILIVFLGSQGAFTNEDAKRLFDSLMKRYNKIQRPINYSSELIRIKMKLSLSQLIDIAEKEQIMTTSVWLQQEWTDPQLKWNTSLYGGVNVLYIPAEMLWVPDLVLYNNADSFYNVTIFTKTAVYPDGTVVWRPPAIFKSLCEIDVEWFPFDEQNCLLKFGSWSYDINTLDLQHKEIDKAVSIEEPDSTGLPNKVSVIWQGVDICNYYPSVEWDIITVPAKRHEVFYSACCPEYGKFADITYYFRIRRKPLFYTMNLIFPCIGISFLTVLVFYLPSDGGEKVTLCISILVALTVFFLLLTEIIPATSIVLPLFGRYLLFTMLMVALSVIITVVTINIHFRNPGTHTMPGWMKRLFLRTLPRYLFMKRPISYSDESFRRVSVRERNTDLPVNFLERRSAAVNLAVKRPTGRKGRPPKLAPKPQILSESHVRQIQSIYKSPQVLRGFENICFIAEVMKAQDKDDKIDDDWRYMAMVMDRLFLWIFSAACFFGTIIILLQAPTFYDYKEPLTRDSCVR